MPFLILADDLSGAAELAGLAYNLGLSAEVHRAPGLPAAAEVIALDTDSRLLPADNAAARITRAIGAQSAANTTSLYKKTDSLLRGNVRAEIEAALEATGLPRALLIPANPSRGRTIESGHYLIEGQPLHQTPLAADPHHPRLTSNVHSLLGDGHQEIHCPKSGDPLPPTGIIIPDVTSQADVANFAAQTDDSTLPAGAADYFQALIEHQHQHHHGTRAVEHLPKLELRPTAALICGSRVAWPDRLKACQAASITVYWSSGFGSGTIGCGAYLLGIGDEPVSDSASALQSLATMASALIPAFNTRTILIEGGATAAAIARQQNWWRFAVAASAPAGIGALRPIHNPQLAHQPEAQAREMRGDREADTSPSNPAGHDENPAPLLLLKPGSYPWPGDVWTAFTALARG